MSDSPNHRTRLLADTLQGDWATGPAAAMARHAAAHARRRRTLKHATLTLIAAAAVAAALLIGNRTRAPVAPGTAAVAQSAHAGYEIISDDELVMLLKDRPLLVLPQENGSKKIVLLDQ
jgi:hypothetical protein